MNSEGLCTSGRFTNAYTTIAITHTDSFKNEDAYTPLTNAPGFPRNCLVTIKNVVKDIAAIITLPAISNVKSYCGAIVLSQ